MHDGADLRRDESTAPSRQEVPLTRRGTRQKRPRSRPIWTLKAKVWWAAVRVEEPKTAEVKQCLVLTASERGNRLCFQVVSLLLCQGADPNARDNWNYTPLHEAAIKGKIDVCIGGSNDGKPTHVSKQIKRVARC